ncbi:hypothetical protein ACOQFV_01240 [Nocardiopsis changdeensis]|uniref:Uncharacterized protein n=1 Tax=Nocardiopsis changdeensis TaxID=2831969 RepID=A0ABX8BML5_9ACTN|nr:MULTISPECIES: hypothetical protein [Nocardiopsis]QUX22297.1 hypothetical protein KGD84_28825 [Nocardiopsis changdeensis]QYX38238.1 hypothetical protein K1J57_06210 [Nocardiopsis sp. MT53]
MPDQSLSPDWPASVHPPGSDSFERTAAVWLFDLLPADYRTHGVLRRYPVALSRLARQHLSAVLAAGREGYRTARVDLRGHLPPHALEQVMRAYQAEGRRTAAVLRSVEAVEAALRARDDGEAFEEGA